MLIRKLQLFYTITKSYVKNYIIFGIALFSSSILFCQLNNDCNRIKTGIFYFYPPHSHEKFIIERTDAIQKEINVTNSDTSLWQIIWQNDCFFYLKFLKKTQPLPDEEKRFYNSHLTVIKIRSVTKDYYTFSGGLDSLNGIGKIQDTIWFKRKSN